MLQSIYTRGSITPVSDLEEQQALKGDSGLGVRFVASTQRSFAPSRGCTDSEVSFFGPKVAGELKDSRATLSREVE
jgi:hypothetical protein